MSIAVVGLLPVQVAKASEWDVSKVLDVEFVPKDRAVKTVSEVVTRADQVVLMTKFIDHSMSDKVPFKKRVFVKGGMTALRNELTRLAKSVIKPEQSAMTHAVAVPSTTSNDGAPSTMVTSPASTVATTGHPVIELIRGPGGERVVWTPMIDLLIGQRAVVRRIRGETMVELVKRCEATRSRYQRDYGLLTSITPLEDHVVFERLPYPTKPASKAGVTKTADAPVQQQAVQSTDADQQPSAATVRTTLNPGGLAAAGPNWQMAYRDTRPTTEPALGKVGDAVMTQIETVLWREAFVVFMQRLNAEDAAKEADRAIEQYRHRYTHTPRG